MHQRNTVCICDALQVGTRLILVISVLARKATLGGLALFVYVAEGFTSQVCDVQAADTAFGAYYMCNKGREKSLIYPL